jgi:hypothetical protein
MALSTIASIAHYLEDKVKGLSDFELEFLALAQEAFIHDVGHIGLPSITIVVRNPFSKNEEGLFKQYQHSPQGLAVLSYYEQYLNKRQLDLIFLHLKTKKQNFYSYLASYVSHGNKYRAWVAAMRVHVFWPESDTHYVKSMAIIYRALVEALAQKLEAVLKEKRRFSNILRGALQFKSRSPFLQIALRQLLGIADAVNTTLAYLFTECTAHSVLRQ